MALKNIAIALLLLVPASAAELRVQVVDEQGEPVWARLEVRGEDGKMHSPLDALRDRTAQNRPGGGGWYLGSFVTKEEAVVEVPAGLYTVIAERGPEYERFVAKVDVSEEQPAQLAIPLKPWIRMNELGWWAADFHIHRRLDHMPALALAEDLNLSVVFTMWNKRNLWEGQPWPKNPVDKLTPRHLVTVLNAEDERGGGAWMLHGLRQPLDLAVDGRWFPPGIEFIEQAKGQRYVPEGFPWFDCEKPFWWEVPVVMAVSPPDSFGVLHNHFNQYGIHDSEAWGRPRDTKQYPGPEGFVDSSLNLYYRYLNLGFRLPPSAGSASGVLPNPVGYNRVYVKLSEPFGVEAWYRNLRHGKSFVTNGPMLFFEAEEAPGQKVRLVVDARSREPLDRIEIVANGEIVKRFEAPEGKTSFQTELFMPGGHHTWVAARCYTKNEDTIRMAHSGPVFLDGRWDPQEDATFFIRWIDELIEQTRDDPARFENDEQRNAVLELYEGARRFYEQKLH